MREGSLPGSIRAPRRGAAPASLVATARLFAALALFTVPLLGAASTALAYNYRKSVTVSAGQVVGGPLASFPMLVSVTDPNLRTVGNGGHVQNPNGYDIIFRALDDPTCGGAGSSPCQLDHEIEKYVPATGELVAWVRVPSIAVGTVIYLLYGDATVSSPTQNAAGVWSANFRAVWHLKEDPSGAAPQIKESTTNANHGTSAGAMPPGDQLNAKVDGGLNFDGVDDVIDAGSNVTLDNLDPFTFSAWVYPRSMGGQSDGRIVHKGSIAARKQLQISSGGLNDFALYVDRATAVADAEGADNSATLNQWQYVCGTYDALNGPRIYRNGVEIAYRSRTVGSGSTVDESAFNFYIGNRPGQDKGWDGDLDEVRVSNVVRSTGWMATEYNNQNSPASFFALGVEQSTPSITGTVFEDANYGGGAGRDSATAAGVGRPGARVELYNSSGVFLTSTTSQAAGAYAFPGLVAGNYTVRVVNDSVSSARTGATTSLKAVPTWRTNASTGAAVAVTDYVGGQNPSVADAAAGSAGATMNTTTGVFSVGPSGTAQSITNVTLGASNVTGVGFGYSFDVIVNTNDTGQGSLRQFLTNANTLGGDASLAQSGLVAAKENAVFMISNGTAAPGLRAANNYFTGGVATISPASALPWFTTPLVLDARVQPGYAGAPLVELNGAGAGAGVDGLRIDAGGSTAAGLVINRFTGNGVYCSSAGGNTIAGNYVGTTAAGTAASANGGYGVFVANNSTNTIGGTAMNDRNVISGNTNYGVFIWGSGTSNNVIQGNYIGTNAAGSAAIGNANGVVLGDGIDHTTVGGLTVAARNVISGNTNNGILITGTNNSTSLVEGNFIGTSASGTAAVPNDVGILVSACTGSTIGGSTATARNIISGNRGAGVFVQASGTNNHSIKGNYIGTDSTGTLALGNGIVNSVEGVGIAGGSNNTIGGAGAGDGNRIWFNGTAGVALNGGTGNAILGNSISGNVLTIGIDLFPWGVTANNGSKNGGLTNFEMDFPVFTTANLSGTTLTLAGYVGSAPNQSTFAGARVEVFKSDNDVSGYGEGRTYLGFLTVDANGNFGGALAVSGLAVGDKITGTATDASNNTSEFGLNVNVAGLFSISGTVFEDANYGGGAGRDSATAAGVGRPGARLELYNVSGVFVSSTTSQAAGAYSFPGLTPGTYTVRVVNDSVSSARTGYTTSLKSVQTWRTSAGSGSAVPVTDHVGGQNPSVADAASGTAGATMNTGTGVFSVGPSGTAQSITNVTLGASNVTGVSFGYCFDVIVNRNDSGQGSLRQFLVNANALSNTGLAQSGRPAGIESAIVMLPDGTARPGMNTGEATQFAGGVATFRPASALPAINDAVVLDGQTQPGWSGNPILQLSGNVAGSGASGLDITAGSSTVRGFIVNRFTGANRAGIRLATGGGNTVQACWIGTDSTGTAAAGNSQGIRVEASSSNTVGGTGAGVGNTIRGSSDVGVLVTAGTGNAIEGNAIFGNAGIGIDLAGDGVSPNNGTKNVALPNGGMDFPVFTSAYLDKSTLSVAGYVGSAPGQATFAGARVELFKSDNDPTGYGEGASFLGALTTDANGNFSGTLAVSGLAVGDRITGTATDASGNTSEFGADSTVRARTLVKRVFDATGNAIASGVTLAKGTVVQFLLYVDNRGGVVTDLRLSDALAAGFSYVAGSMKWADVTPSCAGTTCTGPEDSALLAAALAGTALTDAADGDTGAVSGATIQLGKANAASARLDIVAGKVYAVVFRARMQ
jgi:hypothetical protein